jgi:hypothetical protein
MPIKGYLVIGALRNYSSDDLRYAARRMRIFLLPNSAVLGARSNVGVPSRFGATVTL